MPQLHSCDFTCSQLGSPGASLEGSWGLLEFFLGHLGSIWERLWAMAGALGGFLGSARALFEAIIGCPRCSLQALRELERIWDDLGLGWGGWGGVSKQARILDDLYSRSSHTKGD